MGVSGANTAPAAGAAPVAVSAAPVAAAAAPLAAAVRAYNATAPSEKALRQQLLRAIFPHLEIREGVFFHVSPPLHVAPGHDVRFDGEFYSNVGCSFAGPVRFGCGVMLGPNVSVGGGDGGAAAGPAAAGAAAGAADSPSAAARAGGAPGATLCGGGGADSAAGGGNAAAPIEIGADVWIGGAVTISPGVRIGAGAVIGAGSTLAAGSQIPANALAAGRPCRVLRLIDAEKDAWPELPARPAPEAALHPDIAAAGLAGMRAGRAHFPYHAELIDGRDRPETLLREYRAAWGGGPSAAAAEAVFRRLLGSGSTTQPPTLSPLPRAFHCDYGFNVRFGENVSLGENCCFLDSGEIRLGKNVRCGNGVQIYTVFHPLPAAQRRTAVEKALPVTVGDGAEIGDSVVVVPGVQIGRNAKIRPGSVVTKSVPDGAVAAGVPCRVLEGGMK